MSLTVIDKLFSHVQATPDEIAFRYLLDLESPPQELSYKSLWHSAFDIAKFLSGTVAPGSRIMLLFPPGLQYIKAFYGCLLAGMVAVPLYPPRRNTKSDRILNVAKSCQSDIVLTIKAELANAQTIWYEQNEPKLPLRFYAIDDFFFSAEEVVFCPKICSSSTAFLQYTSGSTGTPKGVIITHDNIIANVTYLSLMSGGNQNDVFVNWLPLFHDLGLITAVLWPVFLGAPSTLMAPATFVRNPIIWLKAISLYKGSMCGAPNFAYDLCTKKISGADLLSLDLSSWRVAYNAAEPVNAGTLNNFSLRFSQCGFKAEAFYPGYGMAEATVFITGGNPFEKPTQINFNRKFISENKLVLVDENDDLATKMVSCGTALPPHDVRIVNPDTSHELANGELGEIWFSGPSVSPGYWGMPDLSEATFNQKIVGHHTNSNYLKTGDLGVIWNGELFVAGRIKDLIILHGKNYYPQDIEDSVGAAHVAIRSGFCAAFSVHGRNAERLVIVAEIEREYFRSINSDKVCRAIRQRIALDHDISVDRVVLLKPHKIPLTSSGKIQRQKTKQLLLNQELDVVGESHFDHNKNYVAPSSEDEYFLSKIWCSVLDKKRISISDNFYDIGGNSLHALEIMAEVRKKYISLDIDVDQFLEFQTIAQWAQFLEIKMAHERLKNNSPAKKNYRSIII